jgi:nitrite reductase/ring-hydroxylating ferredoxin subunit
MIGVAAFGFAATDAVALPVAFGTAVGGSGGSERRYPIPDKDGVTIDRSSQVIVVRYQQHLYAFNLACPHENTALKWLPKDGRFQCPKHESRYQPTGTFIDGRATRHGSAGRPPRQHHAGRRSQPVLSIGQGRHRLGGRQRRS